MGMHYQVAPFEEEDIVACAMGSMNDVMVALGGDSPSSKEYCSLVLSAVSSVRVLHTDVWGVQVEHPHFWNRVAFGTELSVRSTAEAELISFFQKDGLL
jgi:hypothetical protein